jgi:hypothetical protein
MPGVCGMDGLLGGRIAHSCRRVVRGTRMWSERGRTATPSKARRTRTRTPSPPARPRSRSARCRRSSWYVRSHPRLRRAAHALSLRASRRRSCAGCTARVRRPLRVSSARLRARTSEAGLLARCGSRLRLFASAAVIFSGFALRTHSRCSWLSSVFRFALLDAVRLVRSLTPLRLSKRRFVRLRQCVPYHI